MSFNEKYPALVHAMQSGVAFDISSGGESKAGADAKHLRVGVNVAIVESSALWRLLCDKGIITTEEMEAALIAAHEAEVARYEERLKERYGVETKLA